MPFEIMLTTTSASWSTMSKKHLESGREEIQENGTFKESPVLSEQILADENHPCVDRFKTFLSPKSTWFQSDWKSRRYLRCLST